MAVITFGKQAMKRELLTRERIKALSRNPKFLIREQIRQRIQELAITNPAKRSKNVVRS